MNGGYLNKFILILGFALACAGCGSSPTKPAAAPSTASAVDAQAAEALAVFELQRDGARAWALISAATSQAPNRADLAYLQASLCHLMEGCQPEPYDARVRKLDPGNGAIWMHALENAQRLKEMTVEAQIIDAIGNAQRFDVYWNPLVSSITTARIAKGSGANAALGETIDWLGSTIVPQFQPLTLACSRTRTTEQQWAARCRRVARVLMNSDTFMAESIGTLLAQQAASDTTEQTQLKERARTSRYLWHTYAEITNSQIERDKFSLQLVELMRKLRREQDVQLAVVRWARRPVTPPPDWKEETW